MKFDWTFKKVVDDVLKEEEEENLRIDYQNW